MFGYRVRKSWGAVDVHMYLCLPGAWDELKWARLIKKVGEYLIRDAGMVYAKGKVDRF